MNGWIDDSSISGALIALVLVSLVVVAAVDVALISPDQYLVIKMRSIFVLLVRAAAAAASSSSSLGSYDSQFVPRLQVISDLHRL